MAAGCPNLVIMPSTCVSEVLSSKITYDETMLGSMISGPSPIKLMTTAENGTWRRVVASK